MWGFSLEELAKRAQEEASRIAEQASHIQSPALFNLDDMQSNSEDQEEQQQNETAPAAAAPLTAGNDIYSTPLTKQQQVSAASNNFETPTTTSAVTKLQMSSEDEVEDFNFDSWGEDEIDVTEDDNVDNSDETAELMRQESQKLAQQIMEEEQQRLKQQEEEEERKKQQQLEAERIKREKILQEEEAERERLRKLKEEEEEAARLEEQQRLEQEQRERQAAKEAQAAEEERQKKLREEEERLRLEEEARLLEEQKRIELERQDQEEAARAAEEERLQRLREEEEQERLRLEAVAAEEEAKRLEEEREKERLQQEEEQERLRLEEEQRLLEEQQRLEIEQEAQKKRQEEEEREWLRLEEEAKRLEEKRLEDERQAAEDAQIVEEQRLRMIKEQEEEKERELERLRLEEEDAHRREEQQRLEQEAAELVKSEDSILDDEINNEIGDDGWSDQSEEIEGDDERLPSESAAVQTQFHSEVEENATNISSAAKSSSEGIDAQNIVEHADLSGHEVAQPDSESLELQDSTPSTHAQHSSNVDSSDGNVVQQNDASPSVEKLSDNSFFGAAAADLASSMFENQATNLFNEATKSASMFSWGTSSAEDNIAAPHTSATAKVEVEIDDNPNSEDDLYDDDDLDAMYDDDESDDSEIHDETGSQKVDTVQNDGNDGSSDTNIKKEGSTPSTSAQHTVEDFVKQLERMSESHQLEMSEMQRSHQLEMDALKQELSLERDKKEKDKARKEVASQDKFLSQMRELEKKFNTDLKEKDDELQTVMQRNEGMRLKMDSMKREVDGLIKLVDERDDEIATLKQGHGKSMVQVEGKVKYSEEELARKDAKIAELNASLSSLQTDLDSTTEAYHTLKERAKSVATELKDRRVEVRTLTAQNQEFSSSKTLLETQLANLRAVVNQHELTIGYKDKDMEALNSKVKELEKQIEGKEKSIQDSSAVGEKAIASYKRKAQEALAAANSRLALSNQAREEAESEAKAAKSTADDAVKRARDAESKMSAAEERAAAATSLLDELKLSSNDEINKLKDTVDNLRSTIDTMQVEAEEDSNEREKLNVEIGQLRTNLVEVKKKESELREKLIEQQALCTSLQKEVHDLNDEVQRNSAAAFKRANDEKSHSDNVTERNSSALSLDVNGSAKPRDREEADGTIIMLQQELHGANEAIADLKLALRTALLDKTAGDSRDRIPNENSDGFAGDSPHGNDSTPLFYAIEKQNELNTARDEINRLANMLGDAEAEKQEAYDVMEDMKHKMEEANARLLRYEKLGLKGNRPHQNVSQSSYGPFRNNSQSSSIRSDSNVLSSGNDSVVNLEYLKNVMLSYLKAKTLADRRKLVPVISTVLCLTPEEQAQAVSSVEDSAGLSGVAVSFWENLESKAHNLM